MKSRDEMRKKWGRKTSLMPLSFTFILSKLHYYRDLVFFLVSCDEILLKLSSHIHDFFFFHFPSDIAAGVLY